jgi:hypothetical protein
MSSLCAHLGWQLGALLCDSSNLRPAGSPIDRFLDTALHRLGTGLRVPPQGKGPVVHDAHVWHVAAIIPCWCLVVNKVDLRYHLGNQAGIWDIGPAGLGWAVSGHSRKLRAGGHRIADRAKVTALHPMDGGQKTEPLIPVRVFDAMLTSAGHLTGEAKDRDRERPTLDAITPCDRMAPSTP